MSTSRRNSLGLAVGVVATFAAFHLGARWVFGLGPRSTRAGIPSPAASLAADDVPSNGIHAGVAPAGAAAALSALTRAAAAQAGPPKVPVPDTLTDLGAAAVREPLVMAVSTAARHTLQDSLRRPVADCRRLHPWDGRSVLRFDAHLSSSRTAASLAAVRLRDVESGAVVPEPFTACLREHLSASMDVAPMQDQPVVPFDGDVSYSFPLDGDPDGGSFASDRVPPAHAQESPSP